MTTKTTAGALEAQLATAEQDATKTRDAINTRKAALETERDTRREKWTTKRAEHLTTQRATDAATVEDAPAQLREALTNGDPIGGVLVAATTARQRLRATLSEANGYGIPAPRLTGTAANGKPEDYTLELLLKAIATAADETVTAETQQALKDRDTFILDGGRLPAFVAPTHVEVMAAERQASREAAQAVEAADAERGRPAAERLQVQEDRLHAADREKRRAHRNVA